MNKSYNALPPQKRKAAGRKSRFLSLLIILLTSLSVQVFAQDVRITGTVIGEADKFPIIGANVLVKGTTIGSITDADGNFSISDVPSNAVVAISYIGYKTLSLGVKPNLGQIVMSEDTEVLDEVVVTALGIKRSQKALSYNVQEVKGDALTAVKDANFMNSLAGKVAGVQISSGATASPSAAI